MSNMFRKYVIRIGFDTSFGVGQFRARLCLDFERGVWQDIRSHKVLDDSFSYLANRLSSMMENSWRTLVLETQNGDSYIIERLGRIMGSDFNLCFNLNAELWKAMPEGDRVRVLELIDKEHRVIYNAVYGENMR